MAELGSGNGTSYPSSFDVDNTKESTTTVARSDVPNDLAVAIIAVQTELGTDPAGSLADVKTFLQLEHNANGTHKTTIVLESTTVQTFFQASAPTGWTLVNTDYRGHTLRCMNDGAAGGTGGGTGGSNDIQTAYSHTHAHKHIAEKIGAASFSFAGAAVGSNDPVATASGLNASSGGGTAQAYSSQVDSDSTAPNATYSPKYIDVIVCSKD